MLIQDEPGASYRDGTPIFKI